MEKKCKYCGVVHPLDQTANPFYCIAVLEEGIEKRDDEIAELKGIIKDWEDAWRNKWKDWPDFQGEAYKGEA